MRAHFARLLLAATLVTTFSSPTRAQDGEDAFTSETEPNDDAPTRRRWGLVVAGACLFSAFYTLSAIVAGFDSTLWAAALPLIGPWIAIPNAGETYGDDFGGVIQWEMIVFGVMQLLGSAFVALGMMEIRTPDDSTHTRRAASASTGALSRPEPPVLHRVVAGRSVGFNPARQ